MTGQPMAGQPMMPPPRTGTSPVVWILGIIGGLVVLGVLVVAGFTFFVVHKVKQAGLDPDLIKRNPGMAVGKMIAAANPDVDVVSTNDSDGTITIRDKKTGKVVTITFDQAKNGQFKMSASGDDGNASFEIGGGSGKLPDWVPNYPGSNAQGTFAVKGSGTDGGGEGGNFTFTTKDPASKALAFYQDKAKELGMKVNLNTTTDQGGMFIAQDDEARRTLTVVVGGSSGETSVNVSYAQKK
ncbi:MAG TPA: hypothetical protein VKU19_27740 [Bryobacteraceae bacterium]|nr:hypothetical protein [Bryobacteraceae bacterium]